INPAARNYGISGPPGRGGTLGLSSEDGGSFFGVGVGASGASDPPPVFGVLPPRTLLIVAEGVSRSTITSAGFSFPSPSFCPQRCPPVFDALSPARART